MIMLKTSQATSEIQFKKKIAINALSFKICL